MASSQVEIASSSSPFGCVLRDHNQRDVCRESKWNKFLAKDRLNATISIPSDRHEIENENSWRPSTLRLNRNTHNYRGRVNFPAAMSSTHSSPARKAKLERKSQEQTLSRSDSLGKSSNLGAASLVQIWENRLNRSSSDNRPNSVENNASPVEEGLALQVLETENSVLVDERLNSAADWHSDRTAAPSEQLSPCRSQGSDVSESEKVRIVDIIKRLAAINQSNESNDHNEQSGSPTLSDQAEPRIYSQAIISPRIRGRQAFTDLLMQMERERHRELEMLIERRAVSKFPQKGRIQSMLRLRSLQRSVSVQDQHRLRIGTASSQVERPLQASSIPHLRERFAVKAENFVKSLTEETENPTSPCRKMPSHSENLEKSSTSSMLLDEQTQRHEVIVIEQQEKTIQGDRLARTVEDQSGEPCPTSLTCQATSSEDRKLVAQEKLSEHRSVDLPETSLQCRDFDSIEDATDAAKSCDGWDENDAAEELEDIYSQYAEETSYDWINEISRPRSYWEDRRREWYNEMLNSNSKNGEIRQLLERGTVSGFLASEFRERMNRLMETHLDRQTHRVGSHGGGEDNRSTQSMSFTQSCQESQQQIQRQEAEEEEEEEEEEDSLISGQYHEAGDYFDQSTSSMNVSLPSLLSSWNFQRNEVGDDSDRAASTSPRQHFPSQSYYQSDHRQCSSSVHHPSIEIELICDLRRQMEQLYREMSDIRKSLKSCVDMQMVLMQQSLKQEVPSGETNNKHSEAVPKKGVCRICHKRKVDSLLYRCGHMCTCLKCAHELQWNSGKCPICSAPIVDVVKAYMDS